MGTVPPCHGLARRGSFIWMMILVPSRGSVCEVFVRGTTVTLHEAPVDILFRCLGEVCHLLFPLCHRNGHRDVHPLVCPQSTSMAGCRRNVFTATLKAVLSPIDQNFRNAPEPGRF